MSRNDPSPGAQAQPACIHVSSPGRDELPSAEDERQMAKWGVSRGGPDYAYRSYHYEQLRDALAYARTADVRDDEGDASTASPRKPPTDAERTLMHALGVQFDGRAFCFAGYRYDRLADALAYARRANGPD